MKKVQIAGVLIALLMAVPLRAEVWVDFGGEIIEELGGGRVGMHLEIRSDQLIREIRVEASDRFPMEIQGGKLPDKIRWQAHQVDHKMLRLTPKPHGESIQALDVQLRLKPKRGRSIGTIFGSGAREDRPSFWVIVYPEKGREWKEEMFLPYIPHEQ